MATDISNLTRYGVPPDVAREIAMLSEKINAKNSNKGTYAHGTDAGDGPHTLTVYMNTNDPDVARLRQLQQHPAYRAIPRNEGLGGGVFGDIFEPLVYAGLAGIGGAVAGGAAGLWGAPAAGAAPVAAGATGAAGAGAGTLSAADWAASSIFPEAAGAGSVAPGFFDDILSASTVGETGATAGDAGSEVFRDPFDLLEDPSIVYQPPGGGSGFPDILGGIPGLFGGGGGGGGGGVLDSILGNRGVLGTGLAVAPSLAAIAYARNQDPFNTTRLEQAYGQIDPESLALPFDLQTGRGRENLTSSLSDRGVMGSSFGNQDLASYDLLRHAGRQNILTSGAQAQAGIAGQILDAQVKERALKNDLYGRALLALSGGLNPPQTNINVGIPGAQRPASGNSDILKLLGLGGSLSNLFG